MSLSLQNFKNSLGTAARPNNFTVSITLPSVITAAANTSFAGDVTNVPLLAKATTIPSFTMGVVEIPHIGGRRIKVPGDRVFPEWQVTFIADETMGIHKAMVSWSDYLKRADFSQEDLTGRDSAGPAKTGTAATQLFGTIIISHLDIDGAEVRAYRLDEAWPSEVAQLDMSYDNFDQIAEFSVTFQYSGIETAADTASLPT